MSQASIFQAINAQLATMPGIDEPNVAWLGVSYVPQAETPYIDTSMPALSSHMLTVGKAGVREWRGTFRVTCNWPIGGGIDDAMSQTDAVSALFPNGTTLPTSDGWVVKFSAPDPKPPLQDGTWVKGIVDLPWFLHEVTA